MGGLNSFVALGSARWNCSVARHQIPCLFWRRIDVGSVRKRKNMLCFFLVNAELPCSLERWNKMEVSMDSFFWWPLKKLPSCVGSPLRLGIFADLSDFPPVVTSYHKGAWFSHQ